MQQTVDGLIDAIIATGSPDFELLSSLAGPFPALMTAELMGVPHELRERFVYYSHLSELSTGDRCSGTGYCQESLPALFAVEDRRAWLREDFDLTTAGRDDVEDAAEACPWFAITVEEQ
jgi:ferredoxin